MLAKVATTASASPIPKLDVLPVDSLPQLMNHLSGAAPIEAFPRSMMETSSVSLDGGQQEIKGQEHAKRTLEAAASSHNVLIL